jgi:hypothetical protein
MLYWRRRLTRLEIALYATVLAIAATIFLERLLHYMELAERVAMEVTVSRLNSAISIHLAYRYLAGRPIEAAAALKHNPFELASMSPANFHGELDHPALANLERGYWLFDRGAGELVYLPRMRRGLRTNDPDDALRFRLTQRGGSTYVVVLTSQYTWE